MGPRETTKEHAPFFLSGSKAVNEPILKNSIEIHFDEVSPPAKWRRRRRF